MRRALAVACTAAALALASCGRHAATLAPPPAVLPPQVVATFPLPRSQQVPYDVTPIWAQFTGPLDSTTVTDHTVFLKVDQRRTAIIVRWDAATQRILIVPVQPLQLRTTYTAIVTTAVKTAAGAALPTQALWQFTTNSLRRITARLPADGASDESPHVSLDWSGNDSTVAVHYEVYAGTDSAQVAGHVLASQRLSRQGLLPAAPWPAPATVYWSVTAVNDLTGEREDTPVTHFGTLDPAAWPLDSVRMLPHEWGTVNLLNSTTTCQGQFFSFTATPSRNFIDWGFALQLPADVRVAGVTMGLPWSQGFNSRLPPPGAVALRAIVPPMGSCGSWNPTFPVVDAGLGPIALNDTLGTFSIFTGDRLAADVEAIVRRRTYAGYAVESSVFTGYRMTGAQFVVVRFYRHP